MNTAMADGASERLDAQIADALFGQPGMSKMDVANRLRELRGDGAPVLADVGNPVSPSPGDQVGGLIERLRERAAAARQEGNATAIGDAVHFEQAAAALAALPARQPAGQEPVEFDYPEFHQEGMGCGLEDRGITDRYEAMRYGFDEALDQMAAIIESIGPLYAAPPAHAVDLGTGLKAIADERERQLQAEGFSREGDQQYQRGELARAATAYVQLAAMDLRDGGRNHIAWHGPAAAWPWAPEWWKPVDARRDLVRAGALIAAQIDLIDSKAVQP
ncbi:TPA: hypothetical protein UM674_000588 [Stenotrophomonas maltophilia]|nr:hypothetical protein [Stenotrophomonas maltophilia]